MGFRQLLASINGLSIPWFGVSWSLPKRREAVEQLLIALSDRRLLFDPRCGTEKTTVIASVEGIRGELTATMKVVGMHGSGSRHLGRARRAAQSYQTWVAERPPERWQARGHEELRKADQFRIRLAQELTPVVRLYGVVVPVELAETFERALGPSSA